MTKLFVVMGNDFPAAVFSTKKRAEAYCDKRKAKDRTDDERRGDRLSSLPRIFWRSYEFELNAEPGL
jgi:hypothetical protein